jgi:hypothetical protein
MPLPTNADDSLWVMRHIDDALAKGWAISVNDGEEWTLRKSRDRDKIIGAICTTDEDQLGFWENDVHIGTMHVIYGEPDGDGIFTNSVGKKSFNAWLTGIMNEFEAWYEAKHQ